jgi:two-component system OmpR family sensor kinase
MGRLFWKCFMATWVTLILAGAVTFAGVHLYRQAENRAPFQDGPRAAFELDAAEAVLRHAGTTALAAMLDDAGSPMIVLDPHGHDIRGHALNAEQSRLLAAHSNSVMPTEFRKVTTKQGIYTLFIPLQAGSFRPPPPPGPPAPWEPLAFGLLASITLSVLLALYLARPIKRLRNAFVTMASGDLNTRVGNLMRRGDEIAELGREFDNMADKLQSLLLVQRKLLHDVSHELRSPLGRLQVAMGIVRQNPAKTEGMVERMERDVERLDGLIGEILTLSRLNSGVNNEASECVDLGDLLEEIVSDARFEAGAKGCEVHLKETTPVLVPGRPRLLGRAVENVIRNGLKFSPRQGVLDVEVGPHAGKAVIRVRDHGPGIPGDELEAVFLPFHRRGGNADSDGYGLGLAIARSAIELHGGTITARNMEGGGLCVEIRLPAAPL